MARPRNQEWRYSVNPPKKSDRHGNWVAIIRFPYDVAQQLGAPKAIRDTKIPLAQGRQEAESVALSLMREMQAAAGSCTTQLNGDTPAIEVLKLFMEQATLSKRAKKSIRTALYYLERGYEGVKIKDVRRATSTRARDIVAQLPTRKGGQPLAPVTVLQYFKTMRQAWNWAVEREVIARPKFEMPKNHLPKSAMKTDKRPFTFEQVEAIVGWFGGHPEPKFSKCAPYFRLLSSVGCRASDCVAIKWRSISDPFVNEDGEVVARVTYCEIKKREKVTTSVDVLQAYVAALGPRGDPDAYVFPSQHGRTGRKVGHINTNTMLERLHACLESLGMDRKLYDQHSLRRTFVEQAAYACATAGLHPRDAALLSGHEVDHGMKVIGTYMQNAPVRGERASAALIRYRKSLATQWTEAKPEIEPETLNAPQNFKGGNAHEGEGTTTRSTRCATRRPSSSRAAAGTRTSTACWSTRPRAPG